MLVLLAGGTLLSNTLYSMTLPKVKTQTAGPGQLDQTYTGQGIIQPVEVRELSGKAGRIVKRVLVKEGDTVERGQNLVEYDTRDASRQLETEEALLKKLQLSIQQLEYAYIMAEQSGEQGGILAAKAALKSAKLDIDIERLRIEELQAQLSANQWLKAPFSGKVLTVNAEEGGSANAGDPDIRLENTAQGYQLELQLSSVLAAGFKIGDPMEARLLGLDNRTLSGRIAGLTVSATGDAIAEEAVPMIRMQVALQDASLAGGEQAEVKVVRKGKPGTLLLSKAAVHSDPAGTYVYTVEERKGPLGNAFYAKRREVKLAGSTEQVAAIGEGLFPQESIIMESSEPLLDGSRVRVLGP